jgi:hypothetical protein
MKRTIERIIRFYGVPAALVAADGTETAVRAFIRPVTSKAKENLLRAVDELGELPVGRYLYLGPPEHDVLSAARVVSNGTRFVPRRSETVLCGTEAVCCWGLLEREGEIDG